MENCILKLDNINKTLKWKKILKNVSFEVKTWEVYWFLGPNWAWKTTTMKCILGFLKVDSWNIEVLWKKWLNEESKKYIWFMPENTYLYKHLTAYEFLSFNGKFFDFDKKDLEKRIDELLRKVWLIDAKNKYLKDFSKWMLQRIGLAQAIINKPKLLFLDEPMSGLDPIWRKMVKDLLFDLKKQGTTIFFNTHILSDVESICDKISIIHKWNIILKDKSLKEINSSLEDFFISKILEFDKEQKIED